MDAATFFLDLLLIIACARILSEIAVFFGAPSLIGELLAGIVIGPSIFGWVTINEPIRLLGEIGVILLLFEVGLTTDMGKLLNTGRSSAIVALGGFIAPFAAVFLVCHWLFDLPLMVSLFAGGTLTATSIGVTVRTLTEVHRQNSREGQITLGAAVLDDVMGVVLLALLYEFSVSGTINLVQTGQVFLFICVFFLMAPMVAKMLSHFIQQADAQIDNPGLIPSTIVALVLLFAWLAHWFGAPELLGGFAAGLALSRRFFLPFGLAIHTKTVFYRRVRSQMTPIVQLFTPIFFVSMGLSLDLRAVDWGSPFFWVFSLTMVVIAIGSKFAGALCLTLPWAERIVVGMAMVPRGEVGLIFVGLGRAAGIFSDEIYAALVMVIAYTTLLSPFWIKQYYRREKQLKEILP